ncbi:hypothetical protein GCM10007276_33380 [Agaricicola taiwanensis]|uniref:Uncharacterized protein n=1 Tax=Agaricicola taiwanensis TaxID=591372 RepID=A0A8J2YN09_9RHOB|nr:hypothetical protein [Agaricicola taiwanensis]GGE53658.1 hypothetical protein GCM10007276_33380 [Agaricicola taiwanensis]
MSFTDVVNQPYVLPDLNGPDQTFDPQALAGGPSYGAQWPYDVVQANRVLELLRELGRADNDPALTSAIEAELAEFGINDPMGATTPQLVAQLLGLEDYAHATRESVEQLLDGRGIELPQNFWNIGLDQNWQVLDALVEENSRPPQSLTSA